MIVWVWHCPKCGTADAIYFDEAEAGEYTQSDSCESCGYDGGFDMHEVSEDEAVEVGWMSESQYESPYMDGDESAFGDDDEPEGYGYGWQVRS